MLTPCREVLQLQCANVWLEGDLLGSIAEREEDHSSRPASHVFVYRGGTRLREVQKQNQVSAELGNRGEGAPSSTAWNDGERGETADSGAGCLPSVASSKPL